MASKLKEIEVVSWGSGLLIDICFPSLPLCHPHLLIRKSGFSENIKVS